jgi:hypothetical protein
MRRASSGAAAFRPPYGRTKVPAYPPAMRLRRGGDPEKGVGGDFLVIFVIIQRLC